LSWNFHVWRRESSNVLTSWILKENDMSSQHGHAIFLSISDSSSFAQKRGPQAHYQLAQPVDLHRAPKAQATFTARVNIINTSLRIMCRQGVQIGPLEQSIHWQNRCAEAHSSPPFPKRQIRSLSFMIFFMGVQDGPFVQILASRLFGAGSSTWGLQ